MYIHRVLQPSLLSYCKTFHYPQKEAPDPLAVDPHFPCLLSLETTNLTFCSYEFVSSVHSYEWNHSLYDIFIWLLLLSMFWWFRCCYMVLAYWAPTTLGSSYFSVLSFCLFILFMDFSRQEYWSGLQLPSPVDHVLSELSIMTRLSWVALHSMAHSFIELDKTVVHVIRLVSFLWWWFSYCLPSDG